MLRFVAVPMRCLSLHSFFCESKVEKTHIFLTFIFYYVPRKYSRTRKLLELTWCWCFSLEIVDFFILLYTFLWNNKSFFKKNIIQLFVEMQVEFYFKSTIKCMTMQEKSSLLAASSQQVRGLPVSRRNCIFQVQIFNYRKWWIKCSSEKGNE